MKNTLVMVLVGVGLVVGVVGAYGLMSRSASKAKLELMGETETLVKDDKTVMPKTEVAAQEDESKMMDADENSAKTGGGYRLFSPEIFANSKGGRRVLFFYANWCPTCRPADESFTNNTAQIPTDVVLIRVNYNDSDTDQAEKDLAKKYGVTYQHTFIQIDASGQEVTKWNGGQIEELLSNLK